MTSRPKKPREALEEDAISILLSHEEEEENLVVSSQAIALNIRLAITSVVPYTVQPGYRSIVTILIKAFMIPV